jgi:hypothetical protein
VTPILRSVVILTLCSGVLPALATAKEPPPLRVASVTFKDSGRFQDSLMRECDVARIVTDVIQKHAAKKSGTIVDVGLRIDRIIRTGGQMQPATPGGIELGVSVIRVGAKDVNQPFQCQTLKLFRNLAASNCGRIEWCSARIAGQIGTWVSWQSR